MASRNNKRRISRGHRNAIKRFERHRRHNIFAQPGKHQFLVILDHLKPNYNIGKIFRSAEAFGASEIHLIGIDFFDPSPAKGSFKHVPACFFPTFEDCYKELVSRGYDIFILDPESTKALPLTSLPPLSAFVFGHEEFGFSFDPADFNIIHPLAVPQFGKVQSLNVSVAASLVMYEYVRQHAYGK